MVQKKRRTSDCQRHKKHLIPQHHNTTTLSVAYLMEVFTTSSHVFCLIEGLLAEFGFVSL